MALQIDASSPAAVTTTGSATNTSASFTPPNGSLLVLLVGSSPGSTTGLNDSAAQAVSGGSLTWTRLVLKSRSLNSTGGRGTLGGAEIWTAYCVLSPGSMTVSVTPNVLSTDPDCELVQKVMVITGTEGYSPTGQIGSAKTAVTLASVPLTSVSADSYIFAVANDYGNNGAAALGAGQTAIYNVSDAIQTVTIWRTTSTTSAGSFTMNLTSPNQTGNIAVLEVRVSGGNTTGAWLTA